MWKWRKFKKSRLLKIFKKGEFFKKKINRKPYIHFSNDGWIKFSMAAVRIINGRPITIGVENGHFYLIIAGPDDRLNDFFLVSEKRQGFSCRSLIEELNKYIPNNRFPKWVVDEDNLKVLKNLRSIYPLKYRDELINRNTVFVSNTRPN